MKSKIVLPITLFSLVLLIVAGYFIIVNQPKSFKSFHSKNSSYVTQMIIQEGKNGLAHTTRNKQDIDRFLNTMKDVKFYKTGEKAKVTDETYRVKFVFRSSISFDALFGKVTNINGVNYKLSPDPTNDIKTLFNEIK